MSKIYTWPNCTVTDCGHSRRHGSKVRAEKYAKKNQRRLTTKDEQAVCVCHADWVEGGNPLEGFTEAPREFFTCTEALVEAATEPQEAAPEPEPQPAPAQPLDPRDTPEPAPW